MKLLRTIRLDPSDTFVFERAAEPGEWAVSGAFVFWNADPATLEGKARSAFRGGFLGVDVARLVDVGADRRGERGGPRARWSTRWRSNWWQQFGAPDLAAARAAAEEEVAFAESLCNHPPDTLIAVHRSFEDGDDPRSLPHAASARRAEAVARVLVPRSRGRGGAPARRSIWSRMAERERK